MAVAKKKTTKRVIKVVDENTEIVEKKTELSDEDKILGKKESVITGLNVKYESPSIMYQITNLELNNGSIVVSGDLVETFIGSNNIEARKALKGGAKEVTSKDVNGKDLYKIEVIDAK